MLGILTCYYSGRPGGDFFVGIAPHIALAYSTVGIAMNVICSSLICGFIVYHTHRSNVILGRRWDNEDGRVFNHVLEIIMEAMLPYTIFGVAYVTLLGLNSPVAILFLSLYVMFTVRLIIGWHFKCRRAHPTWPFAQCLSPQIIMLRVILGREWRNELTLTGNTGEPVSVLKFARADNSKLRVETGTFGEAIELTELPAHPNRSSSLSTISV